MRFTQMRLGTDDHHIRDSLLDNPTSPLHNQCDEMMCKRADSLLSWCSHVYREQVTTLERSHIIEQIRWEFQRQLPTYPDTSEPPFGQWLNMIVVNVVKEYYKPHKREIYKADLDDTDIQVEAPAIIVVDQESVNVLVHNIGKRIQHHRHPERDQQILLHAYVDELSYVEIGEKLGMRPGAVATALHRIRKELFPTAQQVIEWCRVHPMSKREEDIALKILVDHMKLHDVANQIQTNEAYIWSVIYPILRDTIVSTTVKMPKGWEEAR